MQTQYDEKYVVQGIGGILARWVFVLVCRTCFLSPASRVASLLLITSVILCPLVSFIVRILSRLRVVPFIFMRVNIVSRRRHRDT